MWIHLFVCHPEMKLRATLKSTVAFLRLKGLGLLVSVVELPSP